MFNRFWKNKDDGSSKSGPPGHRGSQAGSGDAAGGGAAPAEPLGGGFFNLPPVGKGPTSYGAPSGGSSTGGLQPGGGAPSQYGGSQPGGGAPSQYGRPASAGSGHHSVPSYGAPQPPTSHYGQPQPPSYGNHAPPAPASGGGGGMDMFGGMSLKAPAAVPSGYGGAPQPLKPSPIKYGGYGGPHHDASNLAAAPASSGSLFSGLDVAPGGANAAPAAPYGHDDETLRPVSERKKSIGRSSTFSSPGSTDSSAAVQRQSVGSIARPGVNKGGVKKKKTKSFRPGFGRQLSDESIAALQRGDLNPEDIIQQHQPVEESAPSAPQPPRMATNPTDLAHLLPPVKGGSVLAGLTVHDAGSTTSSSGGSVLAGLTVHGGNSPRGSSKSNASDGGGLLAGLNVHRKPSVDEQSDASTSVVLPSSGEKSSSSKKKSPPQEPEKPAAPPTPEEKMINTLRDFHASALSFRNSSLKQNDEENKILERKVQLAKQLNQYEIDLHTIEAQQQQAVEVEDFEKADALNSTINSVRHCITLSESDVRKVESELVAFVKAKEKAFINQLKSTRGTLKELEKFHDDQDAERSALRDELKKYKVEQTEHLQFEAERIETELHHVSSNMDNLKSEKEEIEATIEEQCRADVSLREELLVEKAGVQEEILELERQLRIKVEQMRGIQASIDKAESDIDAVRSRYSRQLKRIADRKDGLSKTKAEVEADADQLKAERKQFGDTIQDYGVRIAAFGKRMKAVKKEMRAAMLLATVLEVQETRREQATVRRKQQTAELTALADSAAIAEQSFELLRKQHEELEKSLTVHHNGIASAQAMIPQLEQEKKAAAAQRNFKEAARISKDIKALEKDQSSAEEMVEVVEMELQDLKERIEKRDAEWKEKKEELKTVEKQLELNTLHELWKEAKGLRQSLRKFEKVKSEGVAASHGVDFRSSALLLVQAEYDACIAQAEALESKYEMTDPTAEEEDNDVDEEVDDDDESVDEEIDEHFGASAVLAHSDQVTGGVGPENDHGIDHTIDASLTLEKIAERVGELEQLIEEATENEEYERAAKLDQQLGMLRQREATLKAAAGSSSAGTSAGNDKATQGKESAQVSEECEEADSGGDEEGNSAEELEEELRLVRTRIKMLEVDIERDTENEDYEAAAELEEELQQLRVDEAEITQLLAESQRQTNGNVIVGAAGAVHTEGANMFAGMETSVAASEAPQQPAGSSMFAGMQVAAVDANVEEVVAGSSMFAGMQVVAAEDKKVEDEVTGSSVFAGVQVVAAEDKKVEDEVMGSSMFAGMQVIAAEDKKVEDEATGSSMFAGMQVVAAEDKRVEDEATGSSMFAGMQVVAAEDKKVEDEATGSSMFTGVEEAIVITEVEKVIVVKSDSDANGEGHTLSRSPKETPVSPRRLSIGSGPNSPRRKSSGGMFSGLQVSSGPVESLSVEPGTSSNAPMFDGLQLGSSGASTLTSEVSVFEGLQVGSSQVNTVKEALSSEQLFGGLTLTTKNDDTTNSDDGVIVDADEAVQEEAKVSIEEQRVEETTVKVSVEETTTTTVVSTATLDMFSGLSLASAAVVAEAPTGQSGTGPVPSADTTSSLSMFGGLSLAPTAVATAEEAAKVEAPASPVDMFGGLSLAPAASATADVAPTVE